MKKRISRTCCSISLLILALILFSGLQSCNDEAEIIEENTDDEILDDDFVTNTRDTTYANAVVIKYNETTATVVNPFENAGVSVSISAGDVIATSTRTDVEINFVLSGIAKDGSFRLYSDYKFTLILNGVSIRNDDGPAINIQSEKKASVTLQHGTNNRLIDGTTYITSEEDQKGTFFSEGQLVFNGNGVLTVYGKYKHGIASDDYISITQGDIMIASALTDGIHANDNFKMTGGKLNIKSSADGIEVEEGYVDISGGSVVVESVDDGIVASYDGTDKSIVPYVQITGGIIQVTTTGDKANAIKSEGDVLINGTDPILLSVSGKGSKGIKANADVTLTQAEINITTSGASFYDTDDNDIASAAGVNCDGNITMEDGTLLITSTGTGGKGIVVDGTLTINLGSIDIIASGSEFTYGGETSEAKGIKSDGPVVINNGEISIAATDDGVKSDESITINGGSIEISKSNEGIEAPTITFNGGTINVVSSDDGVNATKGNGGESNDGSLLTIAGGTISLSSTGGDPLDSNGNIVMTSGTLILQGPPSHPELALDYNGTFKISGGLLIASGPNSGNMIEATSASSTQNAVLIKMNSLVSANTLFNIQDASGNNLVTYRPMRNAYYFVFSSSSLLSGTSYKVFTGGSTAGGTSTGGLITGGTYSGGTLKGSIIVNSKVTTATM